MLFKYVVRNVAQRHGKTATFMPKPVFGDNGSGMHTHVSIWKGDRNIFWDAEGSYAHLSQEALWAVGGILMHAPALLAITSPTTNSYKRLVPGYEAPVNLTFSQRNRSAAIRIPVYAQNEKSTRLEFRCPDPTANPYITFSAILMAAIDGIERKKDPGEHFDGDTYHLPREMDAKIPKTPESLEAAVGALERDHGFLLKGGVFTTELLETWINLKRKEAKDLSLRPHPLEFEKYYDA